MKQVIRWSGFVVAGGLIGSLIYSNVIAVENVGTGYKIGFGVLLGALVAFVVGWAKINKIIGRKLQAIATAKELNTIGQTSLWWATVLEWSGVVIPMGILGGLFYFVGNYFNGIGETIGLITMSLSVPIATSLIYKYMQRNDIIKAEQDKQAEFVKAVAKEVKEVTYR